MRRRPSPKSSSGSCTSVSSSLERSKISHCSMKRITIPEEGVETLFGSYDENLKHLESLFNVRIRTQGHDLVVEGSSPDLDRVDRVVGQLSSLMREGYKLSNADVKTASDLVAQDGSVDLRDHFLKGSLTPAGKRRVG